MAKAHRMTPARRAALKKAQAASARKRRGKGKGKLAKANRRNSGYKRAMAYTAIGVGALGAAVAYGAYRNHKHNQAVHNAEKHIRATMTDFQKRTAKNHADFGSRLKHPTKRQNARRKQERAARGTKGMHPIALGGSKGKPRAAYSETVRRPHTGNMGIYTQSRRQTTRLRQMEKAGQRGLYNAGLPNYHTNTGARGNSSFKFIAGKSGVRHKRYD